MGDLFSSEYPERPILIAASFLYPRPLSVETLNPATKQCSEQALNCHTLRLGVPKAELDTFLPLDALAPKPHPPGRGRCTWRRHASLAKAERSAVTVNYHAHHASGVHTIADTPKVMVKLHVGSMGNQTPQQKAGSQSLRVKCTIPNRGHQSLLANVLHSGLSELIGIVTQLQRKIAVLERQQQESTSEATIEPHHDNLLVQDIAGPEQNNHSATQAASPVFAGPTSADFSFRVADIILQRESGTEAGRSWVNADLAASVSDDEDGDNSERLQLTTTSSSLHGLQLQDALRLIQVYHESIDILHPLVNTESLQRLASTLFPNEGHAAAPDAAPLSAGVDIAHLEMAIAIALLAEGGGYSPVARKIHNDLIPIITNHILGRTFTLGGQILLLLTVSVFQWSVSDLVLKLTTLPRRSTTCSKTILALRLVMLSSHHVLWSKLGYI